MQSSHQPADQPADQPAACTLAGVPQTIGASASTASALICLTGGAALCLHCLCRSWARTLRPCAEAPATCTRRQKRDTHCAPLSAHTMHPFAIYQTSAASPQVQQHAVDLQFHGAGWVRRSQALEACMLRWRRCLCWVEQQQQRLVVFCAPTIIVPITRPATPPPQLNLSTTCGSTTPPRPTRRHRRPYRRRPETSPVGSATLAARCLPDVPCRRCCQGCSASTSADDASSSSFIYDL